MYHTGPRYTPMTDPVLYELISSTDQFGIVDQDSFSHYTKSSLRYPAVPCGTLR